LLITMVHPVLGALAGAAALGLWLSPAAAGAGGVTITSYGHSALLIQGGGSSVLLNPFKPVGCAAGLAMPAVAANVTLASSQLRDEGVPAGGGRFLATPGTYKFAGIRFEGFAAPHDRVGGRRFGNSVIWRWRQGGLEFAHLGGTAAALKPEDKVLIGRPDVLIIGVGGGAKVYSGTEAAAVVRELNPRRVIPVQYLRSGTAPKDCDQGDNKSFLEAMKGTPVSGPKRVLSLTAPLGDTTKIELMP
jgi:L-ascorbate metabolism protein UlaG (beta-lactamase superfamily)